MVLGDYQIILGDFNARSKGWYKNYMTNFDGSKI